MTLPELFLRVQGFGDEAPAFSRNKIPHPTGGILRSCLGVRNLNPDLNDPNVWLYVQGLKNPGLKPFQLEGLPLKMKVPPGESPYLNALLSTVAGHEDPRYLKACEMFVEGMSQRKVAEALKPISIRTVNGWHKRWEKEAGPQVKLEKF